MSTENSQFHMDIVKYICYSTNRTQEETIRYLMKSSISDLSYAKSHGILMVRGEDGKESSNS